MNSNTELFFKNGNVNNLKINELKFKSSTLKTGESELSPFLINDKNGCILKARFLKPPRKYD